MTDKNFRLLSHAPGKQFYQWIFQGRQRSLRRFFKDLENTSFFSPFPNFTN